MKESKFRVFVFANLKPSQIYYKILPLSQSSMVEHIFILRKTPLDIVEDKISCLSLPSIMRFRLFYLLFTPIYGIWLIKKHKANLILSYNIFPHGFNGYFASLITRKPFIYAEIIEDTTVFYKDWFKRILIKKILTQSKKILVPGSITGNFWINQGFNKTFQLHSTINPDYFRPTNSVDKKYDFIFLGVLDSRKRPDLIISAISELRKNGCIVNLCMIGYGELKASLISQIELLHLNDYITLFETNDVLEWLQKSKILVMSSLAEGIPCAMLEAMACELIVVVPPVGDIADVIVSGVNGFLHNNSESEIVSCMREAITNYDKLELIKKNARKTVVNEHSYQVATLKWDVLLKSI